MPVITFQPLGERVEVAAGTTILEAAERHGIFLRHVCGGHAICGTCRCRVLDGGDALTPVARHEARRLRELYAPDGVRLACQAAVHGDVTVEIPVPRLGV